MVYRYRKPKLIIILLLIFINAIAQKDTIKSELTFDLGITRDRNINIWPLFKYSKNYEKKDVQLDILFPMYRYHKDQINMFKHSHLMPFYWNDSTDKIKDFRLFSLYYPSLLRIYSDKEKKISSFRLLEIAPKINFFELTKSKDGMYVENNLLFFILYKNNKVLNKSHFIIMPLYWSFQSSQKTTYTLFPLFSAGKYNEKRNNYLAITPLFWHFKTSTSVKNVLFPIWWSNKTGSGDTASSTRLLLPVFWSHKEKEKKNTVLFPVIWSFNNNYSKSFTFLPLFSLGHQKDNPSSYFALTPFFWHLKNNQGTKNFLFPVWYHQKSVNGSESSYLNAVFPVFWTYHDNDKHQTVLFPIIWNKRDNLKKSFTFIPFFSSGKSLDGSSKHIGITPLFWHIQNRIDTINVLFPVWLSSRSGSGENYDKIKVLFPVYWSFKDKNKNNKVVFPILWSLQNQRYKSFTLLPVFSKGLSADSQSRHFAITPFYWHLKNPERVKDVFFPIYWSTKKGKEEFAIGKKVIFPLYWSYQGYNKKNTVLFPVIWDLKNMDYSSFTFIPIYSKGFSPDQHRQHLAVTPFYWHFQSNKGTSDYLFPIWWRKIKGKGDDQSYSSGVFPLYWAHKDKEKDNQVLFPIIWNLKNPYYRSFTFLPLFSTGQSTDNQRKHLAITPLFLQLKNNKGTMDFLVPVWWNINMGKGDSAWYSKGAFLLFWKYHNKTTDNQILFPLLWNLDNTRYRSFTFIPVFSTGHSKDNLTRHFMLTPLFLNYRNTKLHKTLLFPVFNYYSDTSQLTKLNLLILLYRYKKDQDGKSFGIISPIIKYENYIDYKYFRLAPVIWYKKSSEMSYFSIQPFYYYSRYPESENYYIFWQLFTYKNEFNLVKSSSVLWKVLNYNRYDNGDREFRILYLLFARVNKDGNMERSVFPFYYYSLQGNGNRTLSVLFYFYNSIKRKIPDTNRFYQEERIFWFIRLRSNYKKLKEEGLINKFNR